MNGNTASSGTKSRGTRGASRPKTTSNRRGKSSVEASSGAGSNAGSTKITPASKARVAWFKRQITAATKLGEALNKNARDQQAFIESLAAEQQALQASLENAEAL